MYEEDLEERPRALITISRRLIDHGSLLDRLIEEISGLYEQQEGRCSHDISDDGKEERGVKDPMGGTRAGVAV